MKSPRGRYQHPAPLSDINSGHKRKPILPSADISMKAAPQIRSLHLRKEKLDNLENLQTDFESNGNTNPIPGQGFRDMQQYKQNFFKIRKMSQKPMIKGPKIDKN